MYRVACNVRRAVDVRVLMHVLHLIRLLPQVCAAAFVLQSL